MALGKVTLMLEKSGPFEIDDAAICGRFAVHESTKFLDKHHWVITHVASGVRVGEFHRTRHEAIAAAAKLERNGSSLWNFKYKPRDPWALARLRAEAEAAGVTFTVENLDQRLRDMNNSVNRARLIEKRFASRLEAL